MTFQELRRYMDKEVVYRISHYITGVFILRALMRDEQTGRPYAVLQDKNVKGSYIRARISKISAGENKEGSCEPT